jgi:hypothetical protein
LGKNNHQKEKEIKILDPKKIDYTYTCKDDLFDIKSSNSDEKTIDSSNRSNKEKKDVKRIRHDITKNTKIRTRGRIAGGQSKQSRSSVYE